MKKFRRGAALGIVVFMLASTQSFACTGLYVGKDASSDGTTVIARSEDQSSGAYNKMFKVQPREKKEGRYFVDTGEGQNNFKVPLPKTTYKYTYVPDASDAGDGMYPASCTNEYGVAVVGTVSAEPSEAYAAADPMVEIGLREAILPGLIACQVKTAKDGVDLLAKLVDKYGSQEGNILFITDPKEAWIFEIYGGYTYCAMKMPPDKVSVFGNQYMIGTVDREDNKNYVFSKNLFETLDKTNPVLEDGKYNLAKTVCASTREEYSNMRTWIGHKLLAPSQVGDYQNDEFYPLFYSPDKKVSMADVFNVFRNRYEDTPYDMSLPENIARRPIGVTRSSDIHAVQVFSDLPKDTCNLQWLCMGNAENSVFVPAFSGITDTLDAYKVDGSRYNSKGAYWIFKKNCTLAETDRTFLSQGVKDYWKLQEAMEYKQIKDSLKEIKNKYDKNDDKGREFVTELSNNIAKEQLHNSKVLYGALLHTTIDNINDREDLSKKVHFVAPVNIDKIGTYKGYKVEIKETTKDKSKEKISTCTLTKGGVKYVLTTDSNEYTMSKDKKDTKGELTFPAYVKGKEILVPMDFAQSL